MEKALDAAEDAINEAHAAGHDLYTHLQAPVGISDAEKDILIIVGRW